MVATSEWGLAPAFSNFPRYAYPTSTSAHRPLLSATAKTRSSPESPRTANWFTAPLQRDYLPRPTAITLQRVADFVVSLAYTTVLEKP